LLQQQTLTIFSPLISYFTKKFPAFCLSILKSYCQHCIWQHVCNVWKK